MDSRTSLFVYQSKIAAGAIFGKYCMRLSFMIPFSIILSTIYESLTIIGKYQEKKPNPEYFELHSQKGLLGQQARPGGRERRLMAGVTFLTILMTKS